MCCSTHLSRTWLGQQRHIFHREPCDYQRAGHSHVDTRCFRLLWTSLDCLHSLVLLYRLPHVAAVAPTGVQPPQPVQASRGSDTLGASTHLQAMHWQSSFCWNKHPTSISCPQAPTVCNLFAVGPPLCCAVDPRDYFLSLGFNLGGSTPHFGAPTQSVGQECQYLYRAWPPGCIVCIPNKTA